jgi:hypothetical protein
MEFPISRERLQNYKLHEALSVENKQRVLREIQTICKDVEYTVLNTNERKFVYRISGDIKNPNLYKSRLNQSVNVLKELLVAEIRKKFPDCTVIVDPLETYIIIDWS